jgi:hypothetical protein
MEHGSGAAVTTTPETNQPRAEVLPPLNEERPASGWMGYLLAGVGALVSALYLANIGAGIVELGPDNLPGVGNLDEVVFSFLLIYCLRRLGIDLLPHLRKGGGKTSE